jgi:O-antigen ligase
MRQQTNPLFSYRVPLPGGGSLRSPFGFALCAVAGSFAFAVGALVVQPGTLPRLALAAIVGAATFAIVTSLQLDALLVWIVIAPLAYPFARFPQNPALLTFDRVWIASMIGLALGLTLRERRQAPQSRFVSICLLLLCITFIARTLATPGSGLYAARIWVDAFLLPLILFFVGQRLTTTHEVWSRIAGALTISGLVLAVIGIAQKVVGFELATLSGGEPIGIVGPTNVHGGLFRISGPYPYSEMYGLILLVCFAATLYWIQVRGPHVYFLGGVTAVLESIAIVLTFFRATWIGAILIVIAAFGIRPRRFGRLIGVTVIVSLLVLAIAAPLHKDPEFAGRASNIENVNSRLATYITGLKIFERAPLEGVGFGRFANGVSEVPVVRVSGEEALPYAHNSYIWLLAEQGLLGALPFFLLTFGIWRLIRALGRAARTEEDVLLRASVVGIALAFLVMSLTLTMLPEGPPNALFALVLGAASARLSALQRASSEHV